MALRIDIPGSGPLSLAHVVLDFNGTLAVDGKLLPGVGRRLRALARHVDVHVLTADTFGKARAQLKHVPCTLLILGRGSHDQAKARYVRKLGADRTACVGNGRNDRLMLRAAALGIAVIEAEGAASQSIVAADLVVRDIRDGLDLLLRPLRLVAGLRT